MVIALYRMSARLHASGHRLTARLVKLFIFILFRAILPPEMEAGPNFQLGHYGFGVVIHPRTRIGADVYLHHGVTLATDVGVHDPRTLVIKDRVTIGTGAILLGPIAVGSDVAIGAGAVVTKSIDDGCVVVGVPARVVSRRGAAAQKIARYPR